MPATPAIYHDNHRVAAIATIARGMEVTHALCATSDEAWQSDPNVKLYGPNASGYTPAAGGFEIRLAPWVCQSITQKKKNVPFDIQAPYAALTIAYQTAFLDGWSSDGYNHDGNTETLQYEAKLRATKIIIALHWPKEALKRLDEATKHTGPRTKGKNK